MAQYTLIGLALWLGVAVVLGIVFALLNAFCREKAPVKDPNFFIYEPKNIYNNARTKQRNN